VRAGDYDAFTTMFDAYYGALLEFATRLTRAPDVAEDVVQDVFVRVWERRADWRVETSLTAYLRGSVRNGVVRDARWREVRERLAPWVEPAGSVADADAALRDAEVDEAVSRAIAGLPGRCRDVYTLRWYDQLTYSEIAHILGISTKTVEAHITAALKILRRKLKDNLG
jgi:RNA polymerase sigma-70 factor (ECF subfamily)